MPEIHPEPWLYTATAILFLLPAVLLTVGCIAFIRKKSVLSHWRAILTTGALMLAFTSTLLHFVWNISWLHAGGSPHGMGAGPGIWMKLGRPLVWTFASAILGTFFSKGKCRLFLLGWAGSMYFVFQMIYLFQME